MTIEWQSIVAALCIFATIMTATTGAMIGVLIMVIGAFMHSPVALLVGILFAHHFRPEKKNTA